MKQSPLFHFLVRCAPLAVLLELGVSSVGVAFAVLMDDDVLLPGAIMRTALMAILGYLAVVRRSSKAARGFAGLEFATAGACLLFAVVTVPGGTPTFHAGPFVGAVCYGLIGLVVGLGTGAGVAATLRPARTDLT